MNERIMYIGAHNDECEYGTGGVAWHLNQLGCRQLFVNPACLWHDRTLSEDTKDFWLRQELAAAAQLGAEKRIPGPRDVQIFRADEQTVEMLESIILEFAPDIVFIHWPRDNHVEHRKVAKAAFDALCIAHVHGAKFREVYAFEAGPNQTGDYFKPDFSVDITAAMPDLRKSLGCFQQNHADGDSLYREKECQARYRGHTAGFDYAECYKIVKFPNGGDDFLLRQLLGDRFRWYGNGMYPAFGEAYF